MSGRLRLLWLVFCFVCVSTARADGLREYLSTVSPVSDLVVKDSGDKGPRIVSFTSQIWRGGAWRHDLIITTPSVIRRRDFVVVLLTGGEGGESQRTGARYFAEALGVRTAILTKVPNQPLFDGKTEDNLLSYTLDQYRRSGDPSWPLLFPMVASVVRGIDALEQTLEEPELNVVLVGASKRGWTTYLAAAVEKRIVAMVPAVFEMVSMDKQLARARERYGRDSEKIRAYTELGLTSSLSDPRVSQMVSWIDPIEYAPSYTIPKLVVLGSNDPYWVVDSAREYWSKLPEPKMLKMLPNVGHGALGEKVASDTIVSFVQKVMERQSLPKIEWRFSAPVHGRAVVLGESNQKLAGCSVWRAGSNDTDFRDASFSRYACDVTGDGRGFRGVISTSDAEHVAAFVDVELAGGAKEAKVSLSTEAHVYLAATSQ